MSSDWIALQANLYLLPLLKHQKNSVPIPGDKIATARLGLDWSSWRMENILDKPLPGMYPTQSLIDLTSTSGKVCNILVKSSMWTCNAASSLVRYEPIF